LLYEPHPRSFGDLLIGTERWRNPTYLVQGDQRVTFGAFFAALDSARQQLSDIGIPW
jgi:long-chain acyl-CoA synthetase